MRKIGRWLNSFRRFQVSNWWIIPVEIIILYAIFHFTQSEAELCILNYTFMSLITVLVVLPLLVTKFWFKSEVQDFHPFYLFPAIGYLIIINLLLFWLSLLFPSMERIHEHYADEFEDKENIENIIGNPLPDFEVVSSKITHLQSFDFEYETKCVIQFEKPIHLRDLSNGKLLEIDSYHKDGDSLVIRSSSNDKVGSQGYFEITFKENSKTAKIIYGSY